MATLIIIDQNEEFQQQPEIVDIITGFKKCVCCKVVVVIEYKNSDDETVNQHITVVDNTNIQTLVCIDCADLWLIDQKIKQYKKQCKNNNQKIKLEIIRKIKNNLI